MAAPAPVSGTSQPPAWATTTAPETLSFTQVEDLIRTAGGTLYEAVVGAGIALGVESSGQTQVLAGGIGPARGLFQFEPTTWKAYTPGPATVAGASPLQQAQAFVKAVTADVGFAPWAPDLGGAYGGPNANPTAPMAGSPVANYLAAHHIALPAKSFASTPARLTGVVPSWLDPFGIFSGSGLTTSLAHGGAPPTGGYAGSVGSKVVTYLTGPLKDLLFIVIGVILVVVGLVVIAHGHGNEVREAGGETLTQEGEKAAPEAAEAAG